MPKTIPTTLDLSAAADFLSYLKMRWHDESEYENFAEYVAAMTKHLPAGSKNITMKKRPFRVDFELDNVKRYIVVKGRHVEWGKRAPAKKGS